MPETPRTVAASAPETPPATSARATGTGTEQLDTWAVEWRPDLVRVRIADSRVAIGAVWLPAEDMRRR